MVETPPSIDIRPLGPADLGAYKRLRDLMLREYPDAFSSDAAEAAELGPEAYLGRLGLDRPEGGVFTIAAWQGAELVGAVSGEREARRKVRHIVHLTAMMVRAPHAGRGTGRALLMAAFEACGEAEGVERITLSVTSTNVAAVRLCESAGFVRYGSLPDAMRVGDRRLTKDLMVRAV